MDPANSSFGNPRLGEPVVASSQAKTVTQFHVTEAGVKCLNGPGSETQPFVKELEVLHHHAQVLGEHLGMRRIVHGMTMSDTHTMSFQFREQDAENEDVIGLMADGRMKCSEVLDRMKRVQT